MNILHILGYEMLQKKNYSTNSAMTQFRMIPEPYLAQDYKASEASILTQPTLIYLLNILQTVAFETL